MKTMKVTVTVHYEIPVPEAKKTVFFSEEDEKLYDKLSAEAFLAKTPEDIKKMGGKIVGFEVEGTEGW